MEFRIANAADTPAVEDLWAYCFEHKDDPFLSIILDLIMNRRIQWSAMIKIS